MKEPLGLFSFFVGFAFCIFSVLMKPIKENANFVGTYGYLPYVRSLFPIQSYATVLTGGTPMTSAQIFSLNIFPTYIPANSPKK